MNYAKTICLSALVLTLAAPSFAAEADTTTPQKVGVVDVKKVVLNSKEVQKVKKQQEANKQLLVDFIKVSQTKLNAEKDPKKKEELKNKLSTELNAKKDAMDKDYGDKLLKINNDMNLQLVEIAKNKKYDLILTQDSVLYGGDNLTKDLMKVVK